MINSKSLKCLRAKLKKQIEKKSEENFKDQKIKEISLCASKMKTKILMRFSFYFNF
jgi:FKBP-type peptidyl-prolyl cis-trans isomerase (trigger factor)